MSHPAQSWPGAAEVFRSPVLLLATGLGSGLLRPAPGTWGSLAAGLVFLLLLADAGWLLQAGVAVLLCGLGTPVCAAAARRWGVHDHPAIVIDEWAGMSLAMLALPAVSLFGEQQHWPAALLAFLAFRFFDIRKPGPIGVADRRLSGGFGIMADDMLAGIASLILVQAVFLAF